MEAYDNFTLDIMECGNELFPTVLWENEWIPEAKSYLQTRLPHQYENEEQLFPHAKVGKWFGGHDLDEDVGELERLGQLIGRERSGKSIDEGAISGRGRGAAEPPTTIESEAQDPKASDSRWTASQTIGKVAVSRRVRWAAIMSACGAAGGRWADFVDDSRDGRPSAAPTLRQGEGQTAGETLGYTTLAHSA